MDEITKFLFKSFGKDKDIEKLKNILTLSDDIPLDVFFTVFSLKIKEKVGKGIIENLRQGKSEKEVLRYTRDAIFILVDHFKQKLTESIDDYVKAKDEVNG